MSHNLSHTIIRSGSYYYNRRVPDRVRTAFGMRAVRLKLGRNEDEAAEVAAHLTETLNELWNVEDVRPVDLSSLIKSVRPEQLDLLHCADDYLSTRNIEEKPVRLAVRALIEVSGNKPITSYARSDARSFVTSLCERGNRTGTIRRRLNSIHAVIEYGLMEADVQQRNPFSRMIIKNEGSDVSRRGTFTLDQLQDIYRTALLSGHDTQLILPILGETGARLAEIVGLRWEDVCLADESICITSHPLRRLKTKSSEREVPLIGFGLEAMKEMKRFASDSYVFSRWMRPEGFVSTHASNTLNKWLRTRTPGLTCHCFRHTFRDRMRAVEAPVELIDQLGGWASSGGVGGRYGLGYSLEHKRHWLLKAGIKTD